MTCDMCKQENCSGCYVTYYAIGHLYIGIAAQSEELPYERYKIERDNLLSKHEYKEVAICEKCSKLIA